MNKKTTKKGTKKVTKKTTKQPADQQGTEMAEDMSLIFLQDLLSPPAAPKKEKVRALALIGTLDEEKSAEVISALIALYESGKSEVPVDPKKPNGAKKQVVEPIDFYISTFGGAAHDCAAIYDVMEFIKSQGGIIRTYGLGKIMSAGIPLLAAGSKGHRRAGKNCRMMIHSVSAGVRGPWHEISSEVEEINSIQETYFNMIMENTKLKRPYINRLLKNKINHYFSVEDAKKMGIIDGIL